MKKLIRILLLASILNLPAFVAEAVPPIVSYQGRLADSSGLPLDGTFSMTFRLYSAPAGGTLFWSEAQNVNVSEGLFNVLLGSVDPIANGIDDSIVSEVIYLEIQVGPEIITPRQRLVSSPYAIRVMTVDSALGGNIIGALSIGANLTVNGNTGLGTISPTEKLEINGVMKYTASGSTMSKAPRVIRTEDNVPGCPPARAAGVSLCTQSFTLDRSGSVYVTGSMVRFANGRADLELRVDGVVETITIAYTSSLQWEGATVVWAGLLPAGAHTITLTSPQANVWGCVNLWGAINTMITEH